MFYPINKWRKTGAGQIEVWYKIVYRIAVTNDKPISRFPKLASSISLGKLSRHSIFKIKPQSHNKHQQNQ